MDNAQPFGAHSLSLFLGIPLPHYKDSAFIITHQKFFVKSR